MYLSIIIIKRDNCSQAKDSILPTVYLQKLRIFRQELSIMISTKNFCTINKQNIDIVKCNTDITSMTTDFNLNTYLNSETDSNDKPIEDYLLSLFIKDYKEIKNKVQKENSNNSSNDVDADVDGLNSLTPLTPLTPLKANKNQDTKMGLYKSSEKKSSKDKILESLFKNATYLLYYKGLYYVYSPFQYWQEIKEEDLKLVIGKLFLYLNIPFKQHRILDYLHLIYICHSKWQISIPSKILPFANINLDLTTYEPINLLKPNFFSRLTIDYIVNEFNLDLFLKSFLFQWLKDTCGSNLDIIFYYMYLVLTCDNKHQIALYIWGPGGTGKTTLENLFIALAGRRNVAISDLNRLESNQFELRQIEGKTLTIFSEAEGIKKANKLKSLISGDYLTVEGKFESARGFNYKGLVLFTSNELLKTGDLSTGILRRIIYINFSNIIIDKDPLLGSKLESQIDLLATCLIYFKKINKFKEIEHTFNQGASIIMETYGETEAIETANPLIKFIDTFFLEDEDKSKYLLITGESNIELINNLRYNPRRGIYGNYKIWCSNEGYQVLAVQRFSLVFRDLILSYFHWDIEKKRIAKGAIIHGIKWNPTIFSEDVYKEINAEYNQNLNKEGQSPFPTLIH